MRAVQSYRLPSEDSGMERRAAFKRIQEHVAGEEGRCSGGWISCQQEEEAGGRGAEEEACALGCWGTHHILKIEPNMQSIFRVINF